MSRTANFTPRHYPNRKTSPWCVVIPPRMSDTGKRQARFFKTKEEALGEVQRLKVRKENHGTAAKLLAPADEQQAAAAIKLLRDKGLTIQLSEVVGDYIRRFEERNASVTLDHAFAEYLKHLKRNHRSEVHRQSIENVQERFAFAKDRIVADLKPSDIEKGLEGAAPSYRNAVLVRIRGVLNYGMKGGRKWLSSNPANDCEIITRKLGEVGIYSVEEIGAVMATTARLHPDLVPALALMTFAGIRPDHEDGEIVKLQWDHLILKDREKRVELPSTITKTAKRRAIKVRPALASWLQWHKDRTKGQESACKGLVCPIKGQKLRTKLREIFHEAKVKRIQDGLRHSFASYLAPLDGLDKVEAELGHIGGREVLNRHYRSDVRSTVAKKFWAMRAPQKTQTKGSKILQFKAA